MATEKTTIFSTETAARFDRLVTLYPVKRSALVPMLLYAQDDLGYITPGAVAEIAQRLDLRENDVESVLSYYSMLRTKPAGKYNLQVCTNISCMLRDGYGIYEHCKKRLGIGHKEVTADGLFSLEEVECIGACSWAPAMQVNYDFYDELTPEKVDVIIEDYKAGRGKETV
ncbi:complex I 24 kDa subunit family protein [Silvibacterium dinghuense]|uniref:NAD(P)H-dependent oxidoreductase subunit E n=1 Tax=Silvibacterium dinghuense TaxID=1560006 RepID=A0A4Q1SDM5_9BACT|nr:NAD(P)H-dependent oxidoreductase subunit E [Silvibacterium dinghuense]RXS95161.1 NAD(P)H-dependent oxidoreductase subunit E [Silvibacterium dinghuense]GGH11193.1 NADH-quinone oxidoreductase subunit E [Silvibacterium dinghuense]